MIGNLDFQPGTGWYGHHQLQWWIAKFFNYFGIVHSCVRVVSCMGTLQLVLSGMEIYSLIGRLLRGISLSLLECVWESGFRCSGNSVWVRSPRPDWNTDRYLAVSIMTDTGLTPTSFIWLMQRGSRCFKTKQGAEFTVQSGCLLW